MSDAMPIAENQSRGFDVTTQFIKIIAVITMVIDHIGAVILEWVVTFHYLDDEQFNLIYGIDMVLRAIGRAAFPLFIFLMIEGFFHTKSRAKYLIRLACFCFIAEVPFDLAVSYYVTGTTDITYFVPGTQNVFFTLTIGFGAMWLLQLVYEKKLPVILQVILNAGIIAGLAALAHFLNTDYGEFGVLAMVAGYFLKRYKMHPVVIGAGIIIVLIIHNTFEAAALWDLALLAFYHGNRGKVYHRWFFYIFYPAHFLVLFLIRTIFVG